MPNMPPPGIYCVKLFQVDVNASDASLVQLSFLAAPGHWEFAGQRLTASISFEQPTSASIPKLKSAFRIDGDTLEDLAAGVGRWGFIAVDWAGDGWVPQPLVRFISQTAQMRFQVRQIEWLESEGPLEWPQQVQGSREQTG